MLEDVYPGYDPLAYAIEEGHKRGIEVHAWFNVFAASSTIPGTPAGDNPNWICRDQDGYSNVIKHCFIARIGYSQSIYYKCGDGNCSKL